MSVLKQENKIIRNLSGEVLTERDTILDVSSEGKYANHASTFLKSINDSERPSKLFVNDNVAKIGTNGIEFLEVQDEGISGKIEPIKDYQKFMISLWVYDSSSNKAVYISNDWVGDKPVFSFYNNLNSSTTIRTSLALNTVGGAIVLEDFDTRQLKNTWTHLAAVVTIANGLYYYTITTDGYMGRNVYTAPYSPLLFDSEKITLGCFTGVSGVYALNGFGDNFNIKKIHNFDLVNTTYADYHRLFIPPKRSSE